MNKKIRIMKSPTDGKLLTVSILSPDYVDYLHLGYEEVFEGSRKECDEKMETLEVESD